VNDRPLVSIGMPVYNGERFIREALDSLLVQDHEDFELIISDNASTDRTVDICREYAADDWRIRFRQNPENAGAVSNFNHALDPARGDYFMWAAADDVWEPTYISTLLALLQSDPRAVLAFAAFNNVNDRGEAVREYPRLFDLPADTTAQRMLNYLRQEEHLGKANLIYGLMRRTALQEAGGFRVWGNGLWGADMLVVFRLLAAGSLVVADQLLFHKRLVSTASGSSAARATPGALVRTARRLRGLPPALRDLRGYVAGYGSVVDTVENLTTDEKRQLRAIIRERAIQLYAREIRGRLIEPALSWPHSRR
jgi:glycosyltransferase involved in cell wall biosynthesis